MEEVFSGRREIWGRKKQHGTAAPGLPCQLPRVFGRNFRVSARDVAPGPHVCQAPAEPGWHCSECCRLAVPGQSWVSHSSFWSRPGHRCVSKEGTEWKQQVSDLAWRAGTSPEASAAARAVALNLGCSPVRKSYQNSLAVKSVVTRA